MSITKKALVLDDATNKHRELIEGAEVLSGGSIQISSDLENELKAGADGGLFVPKNTVDNPSQLISTQQPNSLQIGNDGKLRVSSVSASGLVSQDTPNSLHLGSDNLLKVDSIPAQGIISSDTNNLIQVGTDNKAWARRPQSTDFLSTDSGNKIILGSIDNKLYYGGRPMSAFVSGNVGNSLQVASDDKLYVPVASPDTLISTKGDNALVKADTDGKLYVSAAGVLRIDGSDQILTKSTLGVKGNVRLNLVAATNTVQLLGKNDTIISSFVLPDTGSTGIKSVTVETNPSGQPAGTYLVFVFDTASGDETLYVNLSSIAQAYSAGDASIDVTNYQIRVKLSANSPFVIDSDGINITYAGLLSTDPDNELSLGTDGKLRQVHSPTSDYISINAGNRLTLGTDQKYFVPPIVIDSSLVNATGGVALDEQNKLYVKIADILAPTPGTTTNMADVSSGKLVVLPATARSVDTANLITVGTDGGLSVMATTLISGNADNQLTVSSGGKLFVAKQTITSAGPATATTDGTEGTVVLARSNDTSSLDKAATPGAVATQIAVAAPPVTRSINTTAPLTGGGDLSVNRTVSISAATAATAVANGAAGSVIYAADNASDAARNMAATPAYVTQAVQTGVGKVQPVLMSVLDFTSARENETLLPGYYFLYDPDSTSQDDGEDGIIPTSEWDIVQYVYVPADGAPIVIGDFVRKLDQGLLRELDDNGIPTLKLDIPEIITLLEENGLSLPTSGDPVNITTSGTWTVPATGLYRIIVVGGGGGGGGRSVGATSLYGGGGGGGGVNTTIVSLTANDNLDISIGAGGTAGQNNSNGASNGYSGRGGGGTSVSSASNNLIGAGGGGGGAGTLATYNSNNGTTKHSAGGGGGGGGAVSGTGATGSPGTGGAGGGGGGAGGVKTAAGSAGFGGYGGRGNGGAGGGNTFSSTYGVGGKGGNASAGTDGTVQIQLLIGIN